MTFEHLVQDLQGGAITLGIFMCVWGLAEFGRCLVEVISGQHNHPSLSRCPAHAAGAIVCLCGLIFAFVRANALGFVPGDSAVAGLVFVGGMVGFALVVSLGIWAKYQTHRHTGDTLAECPTRQHYNVSHPKLSSIFILTLVVIGSFIGLGLVKAFLG